MDSGKRWSDTLRCPHGTRLLWLHGREESAGGQLQPANHVANLGGLTANALTPFFAVQYRDRGVERCFSTASLKGWMPLLGWGIWLPHDGDARVDVIHAEELHQLHLLTRPELIERVPEPGPRLRRL